MILNLQFQNKKRIFVYWVLGDACSKSLIKSNNNITELLNRDIFIVPIKLYSRFRLYCCLLLEACQLWESLTV